MFSKRSFLRAIGGLIGTALAPSVEGGTSRSQEKPGSDKSEKFAERILSDTAAAMLGFGAYIGDRLGIFQVMSRSGPATVGELAARARLRERYMQEWLALMATAGYVVYEAKTARYHLPQEHASVLCDERSPWYMAGFVELLACVFPMNKVMEGFRGGKGPLPDDYQAEHWEGIEKSTAPSYRHFLTQTYLPAMPDIVERLRAGGAVLDLGCGGGLASLAVAQAFPKAEVFGFDVFAPSIEKARKNATLAGLGDRVHFQVYDGVTVPGNRFDLIMLCYTVHHLSDPGKTLRSVARALRKGGSLLVLEANVPETLEKSIGHTYANWNHGVSLFYCMSEVLAEGGPGYGAAIKGAQIRKLGEEAGFTKFRRLPVENAFDALYEFKSGGVGPLRRPGGIVRGTARSKAAPRHLETAVTTWVRRLAT